MGIVDQARAYLKDNSSPRDICDDLSEARTHKGNNTDVQSFARI